jgi:branched-chain amino acid transport system substrate-binding protein
MEGGKNMRHMQTTPRLSGALRVLPIFCCLLILTTGLVTGCGPKRPIKVGFVGCLTGRLSDLGLAGRNAVMLAVEEVNQAGGIQGRPVELLIRDDKHDPDVALQVDAELIEEEVVAIIGHMTSTMTLTAIPLINEKRMLLLSPTTSTNELTGIDDYFVRVMPPNISETQHLSQHLFETVGARKLACVYDLSNQAFTEEWYRNFSTAFETLGGTVPFRATFTSGEDVSYLELAQNIINADTDGLVIIAGALDTAMICQQLRKLEAELLIVSSGWSKSQDLIQHGGLAVEGILISEAYDQQSQDETYLAFRDRYEERFGRKVGFAAVFGYNAAHVLFQAFSRKTRQQSLKDALINQTFDGLQGDITLDQYGENTQRRFLVTVKNGRFVTIEE